MSRTFGAIIIGDEILSGKRQDKHFARIAEMLGTRGLRLSWVEYLGDDRQRLTETFKRTMAAGEVVFSCGGIGNTPDDHTRQAVAAALARLPARRRAVVVLHELEERDVPEIARLLGLARPTVRWHLAAARRELRRLLTTEDAQ